MRFFQDSNFENAIAVNPEIIEPDETHVVEFSEYENLVVNIDNNYIFFDFT